MACGDNNTEMSVYSAAEAYWQHVDASVDGMLGGFSELSTADVADSRRFLNAVMTKLKIPSFRALDCGSGIGRVSKLLLLPKFDEVDMVDVTQSFLDASENYLGRELNAKVNRKICCGLQEFEPEKSRYNVVWIQWVAGHLTDDDLVCFLGRCRQALTTNGVIVLKENMSSAVDRDFDEQDNSWTRSRKVWGDIFRRAGLNILKEKKQTRFPQGMYEVRMFALL